MLNKLSLITDDTELSAGALRGLSLFFLLAAGVMSFFEYTQINTGWFNGLFGNSESRLTFRPGMIATIIAILLTCPLYLRGILKWNKSIYTILSAILILLVFASFVELALLGGNDNVTIISLLLSAVVLSWLGMKAVAGVSWALALSAAIYSMVSSSMIMGFYGFIYVTCGFLGLVLHSGLTPGGLVSSMIEEYTPYAKEASGVISSDISETVSKI